MVNQPELLLHLSLKPAGDAQPLASLPSENDDSGSLKKASWKEMRAGMSKAKSNMAPPDVVAHFKYWSRKCRIASSTELNCAHDLAHGLAHGLSHDLTQSMPRYVTLAGDG